MDVGAISGGFGAAGLSAGAPAAALGASAAPAVGATSSAPETASVPQTLAALTQQLQSLAKLLEGFSSAEILLALMLSRGADERNRRQGGGADAAGLLIGMALAQQVHQLTQSFAAHAVGPPAGCGFGTTGGTLNVLV